MADTDPGAVDKLVPLTTNVTPAVYEELCRRALASRKPLSVYVREEAIQRILQEKRG